MVSGTKNQGESHRQGLPTIDAAPALGANGTRVATTANTADLMKETAAEITTNSTLAVSRRIARGKETGATQDMRIVTSDRPIPAGEITTRTAIKDIVHTTDGGEQWKYCRRSYMRPSSRRIASLRACCTPWKDENDIRKVPLPAVIALKRVL